MDRRRRRRADILLVLVLLLALGLRFYRIDAQSLWNDEGTSVALAQRDLLTIARSAAHDIHPPLYYYLLHGWIALWGQSELAVRSLSALLGTVLVLFTIQLGKLMLPSMAAEGGEAAHTGCAQAEHIGLLAGLFAALSPFLVYYAQETRMYTLCACLGAASTWALLQLLPRWSRAEKDSGRHRPLWRGAQGWAACYVILTIPLLYTHYFAVAVVLAQNLAFLYWLVIDRPGNSAGLLRRVLIWAALQGLVLAAFAPWLIAARGQLQAWPAVSEPVKLTALMVDLLRVFSLGLSAPARPALLLFGFAVLLLLGAVAPLWQGWRNRQTSLASTVPHMMLLLYLSVPIFLLYLLSLRRPMYNPKFLLICAVPFALLLARGTDTLFSLSASDRRARVGSLLVAAGAGWVAVASLVSLKGYYWNQAFARDNYRGIAQYVQAMGVPGDAVLINAPGQIETFSYYYHGSLPVIPLPLQRPLNKDITLADLQNLVKDRRRVFAVFWATDESDPERFIEGWLDNNTYKAMDSWYGNVRLVVYAVPSGAIEGRIEHPLDVEFGHQIRLLGYNLPAETVTPGDILQLSLFWQALTPMTQRYKVFTHVLDPYGHMVGQRDAEPGGGVKMTTLWKEGEQVTDNYGLLILPGAPPGEYLLEIGLYEADSGLRLFVVSNKQEAGNSVVLQAIQVLPAVASPPLSILGFTRETDAHFQSLWLRGYSLARLGAEHDPTAPLHPGDIVHLTLFWEATGQVTEDVVVTLRFLDSSGKARLERTAPPTEGMYPTTQWLPEQLVRDQHNVVLPDDLSVGTYRITLEVRTLATGQQLGSPTTLGSLTLQ